MSKHTTLSDNDCVICPGCAHQFHAIPVNVQTRIAELEMVTARASFPLPGPIDDTGWVLELLQDGRITVSKAREWLRDYILHGKKGPLPEGPFKEPSVWERAEKAEAALADARKLSSRGRSMGITK